MNRRLNPEVAKLYPMGPLSYGPTPPLYTEDPVRDNMEKNIRELLSTPSNSIINQSGLIFLEGLIVRRDVHGFTPDQIAHLESLRDYNVAELGKSFFGILSGGGSYPIFSDSVWKNIRILLLTHRYSSIHEFYLIFLEGLLVQGVLGLTSEQIDHLESLRYYNVGPRLPMAVSVLSEKEKTTNHEMAHQNGAVDIKLPLTLGDIVEEEWLSPSEAIKRIGEGCKIEVSLDTVRRAKIDGKFLSRDAGRWYEVEWNSFKKWAEDWAAE
jgi:hypothetical protein